MTIAHWCLLLAAIMPVAVVGFAKAGGDYNNKEPRLWMQSLTGKRRRAYAAHINCYEALPFFLAGLFVAEMTGAPDGAVDILAVFYIIMRIGYVIAYFEDRSTLRSTLWSLAFLAVLALFLSGFIPQS
ncbi:MAG: MAPEG family protein [Hyphomicrobiales bacterium]